MIKMELKTQKEVLANVNKKLVTTLQMNENLNEEKAVLQVTIYFISFVITTFFISKLVLFLFD